MAKIGIVKTWWWLSRRIDQFPYRHIDKHKKQKSLAGTIGTVIAAALLYWFFAGSINKYRSDATTLSVRPRPRLTSDHAEIPQVGALLSYNGQPFYDETFFKWEYTLRAIFDGDQNNDIHPRIYVALPSKTCQVYTSAGTPLGKNATFGCPDLEAIEKNLNERSAAPSSASNNPDDIPAGGEAVIQGQYGDPKYWFMQLSLVGCSLYGASEGVTCKNSTEVDAKFASGNFNMDFVMQSRLSREYQIWSNVYVNIDFDTWFGYETYLKKTVSFETDRDLPRITDDPEVFVKHSTYSIRTQTRNSDYFLNFYIRLDSEVIEETVVHSTILEMLSNCGGSFGFVMTICSLVFINVNRVIYMSKTFWCPPKKKVQPENATSNSKEEKNQHTSLGKCCILAELDGARSRRKSSTWPHFSRVMNRT